MATSLGTTAPSGPDRGPSTPSGVGRTAVRGVGYLLVWAGATMLLYLAWLLWFTGVETAQAQRELLDEFDGFASVEGDDDPLVAPDEPDDDAQPDDDAVEIGGGVAVIEFERPGSDRRPVRDDPVVVVEGTTVAALRDGPGHYTFTADPGEQGNFAVAGHRTTYGQPFYDLQEIAPGDLIHVTDRAGTRHTYEVLDGSSGGAADGQHIVSPGDTWVLGSDPRETGGAVLTLTTCHPRFSATYRLVVFAQLVGSAPA